MPQPLSSVPIPARPEEPAWLQTMLFSIYFMSSILLTHFTQNIVQPLRIIPATQEAYQWIINRTKGTFGKLLVSMTAIFAPSKLVVSFRDEHGNLLDPDDFVTYEPDGTVKRINLPKRSIWVSNHQVYTDWLYLWILAYFCGFVESIYIIMKESLKWAPIVGISMQFYDFIFLARSWAKDQLTLSHHLTKLANLSRCSSNPLMLLIYPEGTLVSKDTRPLSKRYADKVGIQDCKNVLLPRSTGLLYCARALKKEIDELKLVDVTIGYPGIPQDGYGQSYYTLRSIYMQGVPPPTVHVSITLRNVSSVAPSELKASAAGDVADNVRTKDALLGARDDPSAMPIGDLTIATKNTGHVGKTAPQGLDATDEEKQIFDAWLLKRWREKDALMDEYYRDGDFVGGAFSRDKALAGDYWRRDPGKSSSVAGAGVGAAAGAVAADEKSGLLPSDGESAGSDQGQAKAQPKKFVMIDVGLRSWVDYGDVFGWGIPIWVALLLWFVFRK